MGSRRIRIHINVLRDGKNIVQIHGRELAATITADELVELPALESKLERLTGYRWHLNTEISD